jgi:hypothetical protein
MTIQELRTHPAVYWSSPLQRAQQDQPLATVVKTGFHPTRWGWFPWAPSPWDDVVHPDDHEMAQNLVPSPRILVVNRADLESEYSVFSYGHLSIRMKPSLWREVPDPGYRLGQVVEISKLYSIHEPTLVTIEEIYWDQGAERIMYLVSNRQQHWPDALDSSQFMGSSGPT